jgi:hypothetical protein
MPTVQEIFLENKDKYIKKYPLSYAKGKAFKNIIECRTNAKGIHIDICDECGFERPLYNSCKDRNCPQCQTFRKEEWINNRKAEVIKTRYFHIVFTLPKELGSVAIQNQEEIYNILFKASAETIQLLSDDKKYIGATPGFMSVLHTWGQTMEFHPHLHIIVTGGGLSKIGKWKESGKDFFIPVKVLSKVFRGKFMDYFKKSYKNNKLNFFGSISKYLDTSNFQNLVDSLYGISWYSYAKKPFDGPEAVIEYLGRYTHRISISNNRIVKTTEDTVVFKWKDYKDNSTVKEMSLDTIEFMRRFLLHVLPIGFVKIRYYGIIANRNKKTKLVLCKKLTNTLNNPTYTKLTKLELLIKITNGKAFLCPCCGENSLKRLGEWTLKTNTA